MIVVKQLATQDIERISEIDRAERVTVGYNYHNGKLETEIVDWNVPRWYTHDETHSFSVASHIRQWKPLLEAGGVMIGALDGDVLAGFAILRYRLTTEMAQLAALFVSKDYRRQGIAEQMVDEVVRLAKADGARTLYVSATPSESAVGFYLSQGFQPTDNPHPELFALEPEDIHMVKPLA